MPDFVFESAATLARMIRDRDASPVEIVQAHINRIEAVNDRINAYVTTAFDSALEDARRLEDAAVRGQILGPLHGVPVSIKDSINTAGIRTVAGTRLLEHNVPAEDALSVSRLRAAGAIVLGKTNVSEFCMDMRSENAVFGRTNNPWDLTRTAGGSSGGEAAAIASGCSPAGIGSDFGGSIRVPAHFCGVVGLKTTPGRVGASGHIPVTRGPFSLGTSIGPLARHVEDLQLMLDVLSGFDPLDPVSVPSLARVGARSFRVMFYTDDGVSGVTAETREAVERGARVFSERGIEVVERRPAGIEQSHHLWSTLLARPGAAGIIESYNGREELMGPLMKAVAKNARPQTIAEFLSAWFERDALRASMLKEMSDFEIFLAPVCAVPAFAHEHRGTFSVEGKQVGYLRAFSYCQAYNLVGFPSAVVPCGESPEGLPIAVQVVARPFEEETALAAAAILEENFGGCKVPSAEC